MFKIGTVCSGIGSPEVAIQKHNHEIVFACDIDKYARASYLANFKPGAMFTDMTSEDFHANAGYSDLFIGGIPCQAFSLAGKRLGELDKRGLLFYDFYRYVDENRPKVFIIENVKGLLSDNKGKTFQNWLLLLGNSVNGHNQMFNHPDSLGYNLHHTVLNSKNFGVPQNRERVFIVGIRQDLPNDFRFPVGWRLDKRLKDVLETNVDEQYYLSDKLLNWITSHREKRGSSGKHLYDGTENTIGCITARYHKTGAEDSYIKVKEATKKGFAEAKPYDSINLSNPNSETRRGRVGDQIANTLDTACNQAVVEPLVVAFGRSEEEKKRRAEHFRKYGTDSVSFKDRSLIVKSQPYADTILANPNHQKEGLILLAQLPGVHESTGRVYDNEGLCPTITAKQGGGHEPKTNIGSRIRRLTPLECWRLQGFPDANFYKAKEVNSDTQLYKQAGNSMTTNVMEAIIDNLIHLL